MQIEGRNPVLETLKSNQKVLIIFIQYKTVKTEKIKEIISLAQKKGIRVRKTGRNKLDKMSKTKNHQGIIAKTLRRFETLNKILDKLRNNDKQPFFVIINEVLYQHNLGAIIRTAECAGCSGVIIQNKTKLTAEAVRSSMGATEHIPIIKENLFNAIKTLKSNDVKIAGLEASGKKTIYQEHLNVPIAFIIGGEDSGITRPILNKCDIVLKIPLFGKINSLNMSNAAAVTLFEKVRQDSTN